MGELEKEAAKELRATKIRLAILSTIKGVGILTVAALAPNVAGVMARALTTSTRNGIGNSLRRLTEAGLITKESGCVRLTRKGEEFLLRNTLSIPKPRTWDRKWRVVIFDIPERRKKMRDRLRSTLNTIGFLKLQDSVWVFPYDSEDLIVLLKANFHVGKDVLYLIVEKLENDKWLREHFRL